VGRPRRRRPPGCRHRRAPTGRGRPDSRATYCTPSWRGRAGTPGLQGYGALQESVRQNMLQKCNRVGAIDYSASIVTVVFVRTNPPPSAEPDEPKPRPVEALTRTRT
jgi:hypothetical protein